MYKSIAKLIPRKIWMVYDSLLTYSRLEMDHDRFIGFIIFLGFFVSLGVAIFSFLFMQIDLFLFFAVFGLSVFVIEFSIYMWLVLSADAKGKFVDSILPDALQLMAMNIRAGLTTDKALLASARPEFGPLELEIKRAGKEVLAGREFRDALLDIPKRIKSDLLERTIRLIVEGSQSGGQLAGLLENTADDIHNTRLIQSEVKATVLMYAIFIFFAVCIGAPMLFGISTYLVQVLSTQMNRFDTSEMTYQGVEFLKGGVQIDPSFLVLFAVSSLFVTSFFGGMIIGLIKDGEEKYGMKLIPILFVISTGAFFLVRGMISGIFGTLE